MLDNLKLLVDQWLSAADHLDSLRMYADDSEDDYAKGLRQAAMDLQRLIEQNKDRVRRIP